MLVLTRRRGEKLLIGEDITIVVLEIRDGKVSLGIQAPKRIVVATPNRYQRKVAELGVELG